MTNLFGSDSLPPALTAHLRDTNPWWDERPGPNLPDFRRSCFNHVLRRMTVGPTPCVVVRGPRQVGKTTLQGQLVRHLVDAEHIAPRRILRVQFDDIPSLAKVEDPVLSIARWFQQSVLGRTFNEAQRAGEVAYVLLDEVQNLRDWAPQVKALVDHHAVRVLITGSSSLRIEAGRDSLAGRISTVDMGTLSLHEIAGLRFGEMPPAALGDNGLDRLAQREFWDGLAERGRSSQALRAGAASGPRAQRERLLTYEWEAGLREQAFTAFSERGGYPRTQQESHIPWPEMADHLNETVIQRAIRHDLRMGERGRKRDEMLLEEVFRLACRYAGQAAGQSVFVSEIQQALRANVGWKRILMYLKFLDGTLLLRLIPPLEIRLKKRHAPSKICLCDHALRASWLQEIVPLAPRALAQQPHLSDIAGRIAESAAGYFLASIPGLALAHFPERTAEPEVDYVLTIGTTRIPLEIKYRQRIDPLEDTRGLRAFLEKTVYNAPFGILVTMNDNVMMRDPRIVSLSLAALLWMR